jgi:hypothetical protein
MTMPHRPRGHRSMLLASAALLTLAVPAQGVDAITGHKLLLADGSKHRIAILDVDGAITWEYQISSLHDLQLLPNGNVLLATDERHLAEVTPEGKVAWAYDAGSANGNQGKKVQVHAFQRLPDGSTMIAESGIGRIIEVDREGRIQHEIKLVINHPDPHRDTRLVRKLANGHYLVAHEGDGMIREYDGGGTVVWDFAVPLFDKAPAGGHGPEAWGNQIFSAVRLTNGNTLIGTGNGHGLLEVTPAKAIVWQLSQNELPGITLAWVTTLQVLTNGHIVFGNCHAGPDNPQIIEIDHDKHVLWRFQDFTRFGNSTTNSQVLDADGASIR